MTPVEFKNPLSGEFFKRVFTGSLLHADRTFDPTPVHSKVSQDFDDRANEHVIMIEYRVRVKGTMKSAPRKGQQVDRTTMLQKLYAQVKQNEQKTEVTPVVCCLCNLLWTGKNSSNSYSR